MLQELFITGLGAFLGLLAALATEGIVRRRRKLRSFENLLDEARGFLLALMPILDSEVETVELVAALKHRIHLPIWDAIVGTGDLMEFRERPYFDSLIRLYTMILELRSRVDGASLASDQESDDLAEVRACVERIFVLTRNDAHLEPLIQVVPKR